MFEFDIMKAVLLIVLSVGGNYVGETLGCETQKFLTNNMYYKQILILFLIYFTITFTDSSEIPSHPIESMKKATIVWILYFLFTRMHLTSTIVSFFILAGLYIVTSLKDYYEKMSKLNIENSEEDYQSYANVYTNINTILSYTLAGVIMISFVVYLIHKKQEYGSSFRIFKFITGVIECKGMKPLSH